MGKKKKGQGLYVGVDVGGTKIFAVLARASGFVLSRERCPTPRDASPKEVIRAVADLIDEVLLGAEADGKDIAAVGLAVPGVVDDDKGKVVFTPNMNLTGLDAVSAMRRHLDVPVALGNDVDCGTMGEKWLGSARSARSVVGIFVGTGIGGGVVIDGKLHRGSRGAAGEVGHMVMSMGGPRCGCGYRGCLEALASRTAMERDIRRAVAAGRKSVAAARGTDDSDLIRSSVLRQALAAGDRVVTDVLDSASRVIGNACLTIQHLLDPEVIVMGGGVVEACGDFMLPIIEKIVASDPLIRSGRTGRVLESALGDDAVALGAAALAQQHAGGNPFKASDRLEEEYPEIKKGGPGEVLIGGKEYRGDVFVRVDGRVRRRKDGEPEWGGRGEARLGPEALRRICKGGPPVVLVGAGGKGRVDVTPEGEALLRRRRIRLRVASRPKAIRLYRDTPGRKAIFLRGG